MLSVAIVGGLNSLDPTGPMGKTHWLLGKDLLVIIGVSLVLAMGLFFWAARYVRRQRHRRRHHTTPGILQGKAQDSTADVSGARQQHRRRRRRRRRPSHPNHQTRHPTLAETGGLPPARTTESPPPASSAPPV